VTLVPGPVSFLPAFLQSVNALLPARLQKCGILFSRALVFRLASPAGTRYLYAAPGFGLRACACATQSPQIDYPHADWLGHHLSSVENADLLRVELLPAEDVLLLTFSSAVLLWMHFFGQTGNAVLTSNDLSILAAWHLREHHKPGTPYQRTPPAPHPSAINIIEPSQLLSQLSSLACAELRRTLLHLLHTQRARLIRRLEKIDADAARAAQAPEFRRHAELLRAFYHLIRPHASLVQVPDLEHPGTFITIPLDARKSPQENVRWYCHQAEKWHRAPSAIARRRTQTLGELAALDQRAAALDTTHDYAALCAMLPRPAAPARPAPKDLSRSRFRRLRSSDGFLIIAGRSARDNDELTCHIARGNDVWLHTRNRPGAHVIIRANRGQPVPPRTLREAALVCAHLSNVPDGEVEEILYTLRKHVTKPKGAKPGLVLVAGGKTLTVKERTAAMEDWLRSHQWDAPAT